MKILRSTSDQLILERNPLLLALGFLSGPVIFLVIGVVMLPREPGIAIPFILIAILVGAVFFAVVVRRTQLILDRPRDLVELRRRTVFGYEKQTWPLSDLHQAKLETSVARNSDGNTRTTYRAVLVFSDASHPVTKVYTNGSDHARAVETINRWLDSHPPVA